MNDVLHQNIAPLLGSFILAISIPVCLFGAISAPFAYSRGNTRLIQAAHHSVIMLFLLITTCVVILVGSFLTNNYAIVYVAGYSSSTLDVFYKFTGLWAGLDGSILLWTWLVSFFNFIVYMTNRNDLSARPLLPWIQTVLHGVLLFFLVILVFADDPFKLYPEPRLEGSGLNPLLQNASMVIHPPCMYVGFTSASVPFAFAIAALVTGRLDSQWIRQCRFWSLTCWFFLTLGNLLGSQWAYVELGWGGFWAWDPVENAAIMPWFVSSAFIHSVIVQERRGMLKVWNMILVVLTFILTIFGTFLTRSGIVTSVHSFSNSTIGPYFVVFMAVAAIVGLSLIIWRLKELRPENEMGSWFSKEGSFILNNILFLGCAIVICWGTLFPTISEWLTGERVTVGPPYFNKVMAPLAMTILLLSGVGPLISWKRAAAKTLRTVFTKPIIAMLVALGLLAALGIRHWYALLTAGFGAFVVTTIFEEFYRGYQMLKVQKGIGFIGSIGILLLSNARKYGGYVVHLGIVLIFIGIAGAVYSFDKDVVLKEGQSVKIKSYEFTFQKMLVKQGAHRDEYIAQVLLSGSGIAGTVTLFPGRNFYHATQQPSTEVAIYNHALEDVYLTFGAYTPETKEASLRVTFNPLISYLWLGGIMTLIGGLLILIPKRASSWVNEA